jgi:hypothetical protein
MEDWSVIDNIEGFHVTAGFIVRFFSGHFVDDLLTVRRRLKCKRFELKRNCRGTGCEEQSQEHAIQPLTEHSIPNQ